MKNIKIEIKWALIFSAMVLVWMVLENLSGLHGRYIDYHLYLTNLFAIPAIWIMVLALKDKKKNFYNGEMSYKQGLISGIILSVFIALISPLTQWITSYVITPEYFPNVIKRSVELGYYQTTEEAREQFNYPNYALQGAIGALVMGIATTAIAMIFLRFKTNRNTMVEKVLKADQKTQLLSELKIRFEKNMHRHPGLSWSDVESRLEANPGKLWSLHEMERTGGEPDVAGFDEKTGEFIFFDCAIESPKGRRSLCYDLEGLESRKEHKPKHNAVDLAAEMGIEILNEEEYRELQKLENFDSKTSNWLKTPSEIRKQGGAIFGDFRYGRLFIYHNGAQSYYAARGFRGFLRV